MSDEEQHMVKALKHLANHRGDAKKTAEQCRILTPLCEGAAGRKCAKQHGALQAVLKALRVHVQDDEMQRWGCALIANMTDGPEDVEALGMRMRAKIIDAIVKALRSHPDNADVRHSGLHALRSMCHTEEEFEHLKAEASGELNEESEHGEDTAAAAAASAMAALAEMQAALGGALSGRESTEEDEHEMTHSVRRISVILENHAARRPHPWMMN